MVAPRHEPEERREPQPSMTGWGAAAVMNQVARERPPRIERRRVSRTTYRTQAWLQPADETGAIRSPVIYTRDLDASGVGFIARHDLSAMVDAVLHLPNNNGRPVRVKCRIRRSREVGLGWFEGVAEFIEQQPMFATRRM